MIDNIYITKDKGVKIVFRYADEFKRLSDYASDYAEALYSQESMNG